MAASVLGDFVPVLIFAAGLGLFERMVTFFLKLFRARKGAA